MNSVPACAIGVKDLLLEIRFKKGRPLFFVSPSYTVFTIKYDQLDFIRLRYPTLQIRVPTRKGDSRVPNLNDNINILQLRSYQAFCLGDMARIPLYMSIETQKLRNIEWQTARRKEQTKSAYPLLGLLAIQHHQHPRRQLPVPLSSDTPHPKSLFYTQHASSP